MMYINVGMRLSKYHGMLKSMKDSRGQLSESTDYSTALSVKTPKYDWQVKIKKTEEAYEGSLSGIYQTRS